MQAYPVGSRRADTLVNVRCQVGQILPTDEGRIVGVAHIQFGLSGSTCVRRWNVALQLFPSSSPHLVSDKDLMPIFGVHTKDIHFFQRIAIFLPAGYAHWMVSYVLAP